MNQAELQTRLTRLLSYLNADSNNFALLSDASDLSLQLGDWPTATDLVIRALAIQPADVVMRYRMALILLNERRSTESLVITQALIDAGEAAPAIQFAHGRGLVIAHRFDEAEPVLGALLPDVAAYPSLPHLYMRTLHFLGRVEDAIAFAATYLDTHPDDAMAQGMLSLLHLDNDDIAAAEVFSAKALARSPNNLDALLTAGSVALAYDRATQAKAHFDHVLSLQGNSGRAWAGVGLVSMLATDLPSARDSLEKAVAYMPSHLGTQNALAWVQILQQDYAAARKTLEASLALDRNFSETHGTLAVLATYEGQWEQARRSAEIAVRLQPLSFSGRYAHSLILHHAGDEKAGQAMVKSVTDQVQVPGGGSLSDMLRRVTRR